MANATSTTRGAPAAISRAAGERGRNVTTLPSCARCGTGPASGWIEDPFTPGTSYLVADGEAIYRSTDNRATLLRELELEPSDTLTSSVFDPASRSLLLGLGPGGVALHTAEGWQRPNIMSYQP